MTKPKKISSAQKKALAYIASEGTVICDYIDTRTLNALLDRGLVTRDHSRRANLPVCRLTPLGQETLELLNAS